MQRRPSRARAGSVLSRNAPRRTSQAGTRGLQGRLSAQRSSHMNSALVTGAGPVALKTPAASVRSTHQRPSRQGPGAVNPPPDPRTRTAQEADPAEAPRVDPAYVLPPAPRRAAEVEAREPRE